MQKVLAAGGLVFNDQQQLLLIYRYDKWDLPKGHVEYGETYEECAIREVREETGLQDLHITHFIGTTEHGFYDKKLSADVIKEVYWYAMHSAGKNMFPQIQESIEWLRWVDRPDLDKYLYNSYNNIRDIVARGLAKVD